LEVEEPGGAFDVREGRRRLLLVPFEQAATGRLPPQHAAQLARMPLTDTKEVDDLVVEVVEDLHVRAWFVKEHLRAAGEGLDVGRVFRNQADELRGDAALAADV